MLALFFVLPPLVAASSNTIAIGPKQGLPGDMMNEFLSQGAEVLAVNIDPSGQPLVIYGQLGLPSEALDLSNNMYDDCLVLAAVSTRGEFLEYVMNLVGETFGNLTNPDKMMGEIEDKQFGDGMNMEEIFNMLGTDFNLLLSAYLNVDAQTSASRFSAVLNTLTQNFQLSFSELDTLRIDQSMFPDQQLPFDSIDIFIYQITNSFTDSLGLIMSGLDSSGLLGSINTDTFVNARGSAGGLLAIPDLSLISSIFGNSTLLSLPEPFGFSLAQEPTGPLSIAAIGYSGDQIVKLGDTSLSIKSLVGATGSLTPLSKNSIVLAHLPSDVNVTSITPNDPNYAHWDNTSNSAIWNASALGVQSDYLINFQSDDFPPEITIARSFSVPSVDVGGSVEVTVTVENKANVPVTNVIIDDSGLSGLYSTITITGDTTKNVPTLNPGETATMTYTVTFPNEGKYLFPNAHLTYTYNSRTFQKTTTDDGFTVSSSIVHVAGNVLSDAMNNFPIPTLAILGLIALTGIYSVRGLLRNRGGELVTV